MVSRGESQHLGAMPVVAGIQHDGQIIDGHDLEPFDDAPWMARANCLGLDAELFFSGSGNHRRAKEVCRSCVVKDVCLEYALGHAIHFGVWGGTDRGERLAILRDRRRRGAA